MVLPYCSKVPPGQCGRRWVRVPHSSRLPAWGPCLPQVSQHPQCRVRVTVLPETKSGAHKISLTCEFHCTTAGWQYLQH